MGMNRGLDQLNRSGNLDLSTQGTMKHALFRLENEAAALIAPIFQAMGEDIAKDIESIHDESKVRKPLLVLL